MPWHNEEWHCEVCHQVVSSVGPWCLLYCRERLTLCRPLTKKWLADADAQGDGPLVNALCELGRKQWGPDLDW